ncbi:hypothetical protein BC628DRAFT_1406048 [Trametes gibbosa]|nr:hypothetical protein BC628DRAFT_1406048 [Trametes gibbosa]
MDTLPLETLQRIFTLACTDGGHTGNSLSLTSKGIRAAARTARFHSVALVANPRRLRAFVALYERECDAAFGDKPRIQHLYLTFPDLGRYTSQDYRRPRSLSPSKQWWQRRKEITGALGSLRARNPDRTSSGRGRSESEDVADVELILGPDVHKVESDTTSQRERMSNTPASDRRMSAGHETAAQTLLRLIAPDVVSLTIETGLSRSGEVRIPMFEQPLVALRELTLVDVHDPAALFADTPASMDAEPSVVFPALARLHILPYHVYSSLCLPMWAARAPHVTRLDVTGVGEMHILELAAAVGVEVQHASIGMWPLVTVNPMPGGVVPPFQTPSPPQTLPPRTYPSVEVLTMQPFPAPSGGFCGNPLIEHAEMVGDLQQIVERCCARTDVRAILRPPMPHTGARMYALGAYMNWLRRMDGGEE